MSSQPSRDSLIDRLRHAPGRLVRWLAGVGSAIVSPFEQALSAMTRKLFAVSEGFEGIESLLVRIGFALIWPLRMLWRLVAGIGGRLLPRSVRRLLLAPFQALSGVGQAVGGGFMRAAEALNLDGVVLRLIKWTRPFWYPFAALGGFLHAWLSSRSFRQFLWGLPVFVVLLPLAAIAGWTLLFGNTSVATQYRLAINEAREKKDYGRVGLFERKLAQLGVGTQLAEYQTANALAQDGKYAEAYDRMQRLAPHDRTGYPHAHLWIVQQLMKGALKVSDEERHRLVKLHLEHLQTLGAKGPDIDLLRAIWHLQNAQPEEATKLLEPIASRYSPAATLRMEIQISLKRLEDARRDARWVRSHMEDHVRRGKTLSPRELHSWSIAEELLGNLSKAHTLVEQWLKAEPGNKEARTILAELSRRLFDEALAAPDPDSERLAALFGQAAEFTDDPTRLQQQVATLYRLKGDFPVAKEVVERVAESPKTPAAILEAIGTVAATAGELDKAKIYLQRAANKDPRHAVAWNNYAWVVLQEPQGDLDDALAAVTKALEIQPDEFRFRETRGQVLVRLERWQDAIADLEYAANGMPESRDIHLSLAKAYDALGDKQLARVHREHAQ
jgi:tetratricopeptide (TPR) repeat protein